jgi:hypothetical protein
MKKTVLALILMGASFASANVITVRFTSCSNNSQYVCASVYNDLTTGTNYGGQEMGVDDYSGKVNDWLRSGSGPITTNIEGRVLRVNSIGGGSYYKLTVNGFSNEGPRPRGF